MIKSKQTDKVYVGSTELTLNKRFSKHKTQHCTSQEILKHADAEIELLECYECEDEKQLKKREGEYIKQYNCVNERIAGRTKKEYYQDNKEAIAEYYRENKEELNKKHKQYYENNKEKINEKFECPCGGRYTRYNKAKHFRTKMHQDYFKD